MVTGFNHSGFVVRDIEKMVEFYRDALGLTVIWAPPMSASTWTTWRSYTGI